MRKTWLRIPKNPSKDLFATLKDILIILMCKCCPGYDDVECLAEATDAEITELEDIFRTLYVILKDLTLYVKIFSIFKMFWGVLSTDDGKY